MDYKNEKLNIIIGNSHHFELKEAADHVELWHDGTLKFRIYDSSEVYAHSSSEVRAYGSSTVHAHDSSKVYAHSSSKVTANGSSTVHAHGSSEVYAHDFSTVYQLGQNTVATENHYGAVIKQVFKVKKKMIVYKKLRNGLIAELELNRGQVFQSENHSKCRTDSAKVLGITSLDGKKSFIRGISQKDVAFEYRVGEVVKAPYDPEIKECSTGIHFFLSRRQAENY